jgi:hypothetical protein
MARAVDSNKKSVVKRTCQGGKVKTSTLNKTQKRSFKKYRGQG